MRRFTVSWWALLKKIRLDCVFTFKWDLIPLSSFYAYLCIYKFIHLSTQDCIGTFTCDVLTWETNSTCSGINVEQNCDNLPLIWVYLFPIIFTGVGTLSRSILNRSLYSGVEGEGQVEGGGSLADRIVAGSCTEGVPQERVWGVAINNFDNVPIGFLTLFEVPAPGQISTWNLPANISI